MQAVDQDSRKNRIYAGIASFAYVVILLLLILLLKFNVKIVDNASEGLLINFGSTETGWGDTDLAASDEIADALSASQAASQQSANDVLTQDTEEAPVIPPDRRTTQQPTQPTPTQPTQTTEPPVEQPRQVDQRALFPGRTTNSTATSEGTAGGAGNQGNLAGDPTGSHEGTGTGNDGISYDLGGRSKLGNLPLPQYPVRETGKIIIEIRVDRQGKVISASFHPMGSTILNSALTEAARQAALKAQFEEVDENAPSPQIGTITYNFRMQ